MRRQKIGCASKISRAWARPVLQFAQACQRVEYELKFKQNTKKCAQVAIPESQTFLEFDIDIVTCFLEKLVKIRLKNFATQKMKFPIRDFFSKCD